jgi:hypothetical protein
VNSEVASKGRKVRFEMFTAIVFGWSKVFQQAADFASDLGPDRVISISHSEGK